MGSSISDINPAYADESGRSAGHDDQNLRNTLLAGAIGALVAGGIYFVYTRLEDEQKEALRQRVSRFVEDKIADVRSQFKL